MSRYTIRMNFRKALEQAREVEDISKDLSNLSRGPFEEAMNQLAANWTGENSRKFVAKGGLLREQLEGTSRELKDTAETIRRIAQEIYEAEMEALRIAEERRH